MAKNPGTDPSALPLPAGGGSQRPIDEAFQTDLNTGSGSYEIPLKLPRGVDDLTPVLALKYSTGAGNGPFGLGWSLSLPAITRRTERAGLRFDHDDTFYLESRELTPDGGGRYRLLAESQASIIERDEDDDHWTVTSGTGLVLAFGLTPQARTGVSAGTLEWHLSRIQDINGNAVEFGYEEHLGQAYLTSVRYAVYDLVLSYQDRPDPSSSFRSGHEVRTARRCTAIDLWLTRPTPPPGQPAPEQVKSCRLGYSLADGSGISLLTQVQLVAMAPPDDSGAAAELPLEPVTFEYTRFDPRACRLRTVQSATASAPPALTGPDVTLLDLDGVGRPGVIEVRDGTARFWPSLPGLRWGPPRVLDDLPLNADLGEDFVRFLDMDGNGTADLLVGAQQAGGYFPSVPGRGWGPMVRYRDSPAAPFTDAASRFVDLDGDNVVDLMTSDQRAFYHYLNRGADGWADPVVVPRRHRLEDWPDVDLADPHVRFADIVGDGRSHLVVVYDGRVLYYPNLGGGLWGPMRRMTGAPRLPRGYDPGRVFLTDVDGDGTADLVYVGFDQVSVWLNQSGNGFGEEIVIGGTPPVASTAVVAADVGGRGTNGLLFSYPASLQRPRDYRYLDFAAGQKPYLLSRITDTRHVTTDIRYGSSADWPRDQADPELAAQPAFLPFAVPVVQRLTTRDPATGVVSASRFGYWNGNFDPVTRSFLGFARAERIDEGDDTVRALRNVCYFHNDGALLRGSPRHSLVLDDETAGLFEETLVEYDTSVIGTTAAGVDIRRVARAAVRIRTFEQEATGDPDEVLTEYGYDQAGNVTTETVRERWTDHGGIPQEQVLTTRRRYAVHPVRGLTGLICRETVSDGAGVVRTDRQTFYDGPAGAGLPLGQADLGNIVRVRDFAFTAATAADAYPVLADLTDLADLAALGYRHQADAVLADAFCADTFTQTLDGRGNLVGRRDAVGSLTRFTYDQAGIYPVRVDFANGLHVEVEYDYRYGMITRYVEVNGVAQEFSYDAAGRLTAVLRFDDPPGQPYLEYRYDDAAPVASQTTLTRSVAGGSQQRRVEYLDGLAQVLQVRAEAEDGRVTVTGRKDFNARGLLGREYQAYFSAGLDFSLADQVPPVHTSYAYDARGRSVRRADWQGEVYASSYGRGHVVHRDPLDTPGDPAADTPRTDWHDARGRTVAIAEAREQGGSYLTEYGFDAVGNRVRVQVNGSLFAANTFDGLGRRIRSDYRDAGTWRFLFDAAGRLVSSQDGKGDIVHYRYDAVGRPVELRYGGPAGPVQEEYEYDTGAFAAGSLTRVSGPFGEVRYEYGACRCVMAKTRRYPGLPGPLTVSYSRDSLQRITKVSYPDGHEQVIGYGAGGLIQSLPGVIDSVSYGPTGRRTRVAYSSGVVTDYDYDPASLRLTRLRTTGPDGLTTYQDASYDYDPLGAVRGITDAASVPGHLTNDRSYGYDALQQLVTSAGTGAGGPYSHAYEYDEWCNPEHFPEGPGAGSLQHQDADHPLRITGVAGQPGAVYQYDESGNLTRSLHHSYEYDARNRLTRVISDSGTVTTHLYDHVGNRVASSSTTTAAGGTHQRFDFDGLYLVTDGDAVKIVFDESGQVAMIRSDGSGVVFHQDHLGSHTDETDLASGLLLSHVDYLPFGTPSAAQALAGPFGFGGKLTDADDGLVYFGGRYYLPEIGRFLTPDPSFLLQQPDRFFRAPRSLHLYVYVLNDPLNMIDPYGLFFGIDDLIVAAVGFVVGVAAYAINTAISGGSFSWQEALFSGLMGAASIWLTYSTFGAGVAIIAGAAMLAKPAICGALDKAAMGDGFGSRLLGFFSFAIKFASAPYTSSAGLVIGAFGTGFGLWGKVDWFKGGVLAFEYSPGSSTFSALTTGATVNIWQGNSTAPSFLHELYHSRQYTYFGDAFIPAWILGGVWGLVTSAIAGKPQWGCFPAANPSGTYGNPLESTAETISAGSLCT